MDIVFRVYLTDDSPNNHGGKCQNRQRMIKYALQCGLPEFIKIARGKRYLTFCNHK